MQIPFKEFVREQCFCVTGDTKDRDLRENEDKIWEIR